MLDERKIREILGKREQALRQHFKRPIRCLHPNASDQSCSDIIAAHSISRSRELGAIVDGNNHVGSFYPQRPTEVMSGQLEVKTIGWKEASTFPAFCSFHDSETFRSLEVEQFTNTKQQCFLVGYRALCHELFQKQAAVLSHDKDNVGDLSAALGLPADALPILVQASEVLQGDTEGGLRRMHALKAELDVSLVSSSFDDWKTAAIFFEGPLTLLTTGVVTPTMSLLDNRRLQSLDATGVALEDLMLGIVAVENGGAVILMWKKSSTIVETFVSELLTFSPRRERLNVFVQYVFKHIENTYFSLDWWHGLPRRSLDHLHDLAYLGISQDPYRTKTRYIPNVTRIPWVVGDIIIQ